MLNLILLITHTCGEVHNAVLLLLTVSNAMHFSISFSEEIIGLFDFLFLRRSFLPTYFTKTCNTLASIIQPNQDGACRGDWVN